MDFRGNLKGSVKGLRRKIEQLAREHNLDPDRVETWPEEIKKKIM